MGLVVSRLPSQLSGWLSGKVTEKPLLTVFSSL